MNELRSRCHGAKIIEFGGVKLDELGHPMRFKDYQCTKCHKPCEVEEKDHDEEWKNARDAYSGKREEK